MIREAAVGNLREALLAEGRGAERVELCENLAEEGTTPSYGTIKMCRELLRIPIVVMIRPRGGDFVYDDAEFRVMLEDIRICRELHVDGISTGILRSDHTVDYERMRQIREACGGSLKVTFHKAIDETPDYEEAVRRLRAEGLIDRVLTSGQQETAVEGLEQIRRLQNIEGLEVVAAGRITKENLPDLAAQLRVTSFHGKRIV